MPEWEGGNDSVKVSVQEALDRLRNSKEGESGVLELEGDDAMELMETLFKNSEDANSLPEGLKALLEGAGIEVEKAAVVRIDKRGLKHPMSDPAQAKDFLDQFLGYPAEEDDKFLDAQRDITGHGDKTSLRELREWAEVMRDAADKGDMSAVEGGMALSILGLIDMVLKGSDLLRDAERIILAQKKGIEMANRHLTKYKDHMVIEHGVAPDTEGLV